MNLVHPHPHEFKWRAHRRGAGDGNRTHHDFVGNDVSRLAGARVVWYPTRELNPENPISKTGTYASSVSGALIWHDRQESNLHPTV
jgi:hypothetical protein